MADCQPAVVHGHNWMPLSGSGVRGDAAIARNSGGRLEVFVVGGDNSLWHKWQMELVAVHGQTGHL